MVDADTPSWWAACRVESVLGHRHPWSPEPPPLALNAGESGPNPFGAPGTLELTDGTEDVHLEFSRRRCRVDPFGHAQRLEVVEQCDQMLEAAAEPVEPPADQDIDAPSLGVPNQLVQGRAVVQGTADALIEILAGLPASRLDEPPQLLKLVFDLLVLDRARSAVQRSGLAFKILDENVETTSGHVPSARCTWPKGWSSGRWS